MNGHEKLLSYMQEHKVRGEPLLFQKSCHSVAEAAAAVGAPPSSFVKSICMETETGSLVVAIVAGEDRASTSRVAQALKIARPRVLDPDEIEAKTGFPCGGLPSFGFSAQFLVDIKVMEQAAVYTGGGVENSLVKITPAEMLSANKGTVLRVRK